MNIVLEDNINFYEELNKLDFDDEEEKSVCLLTDMELDNNHITLPCNHKFNFYPLYKEVCAQKITSKTSHLNTDKLKYNEIKCPYCRQKSDKLLPHIKINDKILFYGSVNSPEKYCMSFHNCSYVFKSGKNKNSICPKSAYYNETYCYCNQHHTLMSKKVKNNTVTQSLKCKTLLKSGKRKGEECGLKMFKDGCCKRHLPK